MNMSAWVKNFSVGRGILLSGRNKQWPRLNHFQALTNEL